ISLFILCPPWWRFLLVLICERVPWIRREADSFGQPEFFPHDVGAANDGDHLIEGDSPRHAFPAESAVARDDEALHRNELERLADGGGHLIRRLDLEVAMVDDANCDLLAGDRLPDRFKIKAGVGRRLERHDVDIELVQQRERARVRLICWIEPLLRGVAPARVAPD